MPRLQNLFQQTSIQQDLIGNLLSSLQTVELLKMGNCLLPRGSENNGCVESIISKWDRVLLMKISELQTRLQMKKEGGGFTVRLLVAFLPVTTIVLAQRWTPQSFTSSWKKRAEVQQQDIFSFLDEDGKVELKGRSLGTSMQFDSFGFTAAEFARKQVEKEQQQRRSSMKFLHNRMRRMSKFDS